MALIADWNASVTLSYEGLSTTSSYRVRLICEASQRVTTFVFWILY